MAQRHSWWHRALVEAQHHRLLDRGGRLQLLDRLVFARVLGQARLENGRGPEIAQALGGVALQLLSEAGRGASTWHILVLLSRLEALTVFDVLVSTRKG